MARRNRRRTWSRAGENRLQLLGHGSGCGGVAASSGPEERATHSSYRIERIPHAYGTSWRRHACGGCSTSLTSCSAWRAACSTASASMACAVPALSLGRLGGRRGLVRRHARLPHLGFAGAQDVYRELKAARKRAPRPLGCDKHCNLCLGGSHLRRQVGKES